jgi:hypothetical protein
MNISIKKYNKDIAHNMNLGCEELITLNWIETAFKYRHPQKFQIKNENFFEIKYSSLLKELPILKISKQTLSKRIIKNLVNANVLKREIIQGSFGTLSVFNFGKCYKLLN